MLSWWFDHFSATEKHGYEVSFQFCLVTCGGISKSMAHCISFGDFICFSSDREDKLFGATRQKQQCLLCGQPFWISAGMNANEFFENWVWILLLPSQAGSHWVAQTVVRILALSCLSFPSAGPQLCSTSLPNGFSLLVSISL